MRYFIAICLAVMSMSVSADMGRVSSPADAKTPVVVVGK